ncbi:hypothetical protein EVAR_60882_1 [Eumeta japonica]|uniref:Uncharacterized protein n=1 Tax=Eumeta variegata TaxID=151549 RepID=A0A4C1YKT2_EUMVA|nr:hypothetical protein EVAR_60882_1 [Eumeta japonica]
MENISTKGDEKRSNKKFLYKVIKKKFRNLFGTCSSSDKSLIRKILDEKLKKNDNASHDKNKLESTTCLEKDVIFIELSSDSENSLDEGSSYQAKRAKYAKDLLEKIEEVTIVVQEVNNANDNTSDKRKQCSPTIKSSDINKMEEIKKSPENKSCINTINEDFDENNQISNPKKNYKTMIENESNVELYVEIENEYAIENNTIIVYETDDSESKIIKVNNEPINEKSQIKYADHNEENVEQDKNLKSKSTIFQADFNKPDVQNGCLDFNPQKEVNCKEVEKINNENKTDSSCDRNETEQRDENSLRLPEKKNNCDDVKRTDTECAKEHSYLQILNTQSIVLEVESVLFKTMLSAQNPKFQREVSYRQRNSNGTDISQGQVATFNGNNQNNPHNSTVNNIKDHNINELLANGNSKSNKQSLPRKRGKKPKQATNSTATSNETSQLEFTPPLAMHPMEYEFHIYRKPNSGIQQISNDAVAHCSSVNPAQCTSAHVVHPERSSYYNNQSTSMNSPRNNAISTQNVEVPVPPTHPIRPRVPLLSPQTQSKVTAFLQRPPPPPYARPQQTKYYDYRQRMIPQRFLQPPNPAFAHRLPFTQYESLNEMCYYSDRSQPLIPRDKSFINPIGPAHNDQMVISVYFLNLIIDSNTGSLFSNVTININRYFLIVKNLSLYV